MPTAGTTSLKLDPKTKSRLKKLAKSRQRSAHWLMLQAIAQYVDREERREQFRRDALAAWTEFQAAGQHVTAAEADAWLARLENGEDAEPPRPHD